MYIRILSLTGFRNYETLNLESSSELNILVGRNAQGKSAILEAIYLLATSKSHRTSHDMDMIRLGDPSARVFADVTRSYRNDVTLEVILSRSDKKSVRVNTVKHSKISDIVGQLNAVIFSNSDIEMVKGEPSRRRRFLNLEISQVSPQYVYALGRYKRVLDQRNNLLREIKMGNASAYGLEVWDKQLAAYGAAIIIRRAEFVGFLSDAAVYIYSSLTGHDEELGIVYKPSIEISPSDSEESITEKFAQILASKREIDTLRGTTHAGPHRDDINLTINNLSARDFASQGQQRTAAIALKLAEIDLIQNSMNESPVVLLDDIMAELDEGRRRRIFEATAGRCQTFVTTAHLEELDESIIKNGTVFEVKAGKVTKK